jgi:hypothetical protein
MIQIDDMPLKGASIGLVDPGLGQPDAHGGRHVGLHGC